MSARSEKDSAEMVGIRYEEQPRYSTKRATQRQPPAGGTRPRDFRRQRHDVAFPLSVVHLPRLRPSCRASGRRANPGIDPAGSLMARQVIEAWPEIGPAVVVHDVTCGWREMRTHSPWEWVEAAPGLTPADTR